jgi:dihydrofolate reductase
MRKVIVSEFVSLDGLMEDPGGAEGFEHGGWSTQLGGEEQERFKFDELASADALLLGRVTYEGFAAAWSVMMDQYEGLGQAELEAYAGTMNSYPKHVASTTLEEPLEWNNSTLIKGNVAEEVLKLKQQPGKDILVFGSGKLVNTLMKHDLVDEYRLMVFSIVLGSASLGMDMTPPFWNSRGYEGVRLGRRSPHLPAGRRVGRPSRTVAGNHAAGKLEKAHQETERTAWTDREVLIR